MISCIISFLGSILSFIDTYFSYIQYKRTKTVKESVEEFRDEIEQEIENVKISWIDTLSLSVSCHIGPNAVAVGIASIYNDK